MRGIFDVAAAGLVETKAVAFEQGWADYFATSSSKTGVSVTVDRALQVSTVLACARVLANGIAQVPFPVYREGADGSKIRATDSPIYKLLHRRPNEWMTAFEFRQTLMFHAVMTGNGFAFINRLGREPRELIPLLPSRVQVRQAPDYGLVYQVSDANGVIGTYPRTSILHIRGPSWNSYLGMDATVFAREAIGLAIATEETQARLHANGVRPGGVLTVDHALGEEARERLRKALGEREGLLQAGKTLVVDKGASFVPFPMKGVDAQHLETRKFQIEEICRNMGVFPQMVGHSDKTATFASAESFFQAHVTHSLQPWASCWDQAVERDLLADYPDLFAKLDLRGLLRGDFKTRMEGYSRALGSGGSPAWMTQDEVRELEDLDPMGGDAARLPVATNIPAPASTAGG